MEHVVDKQKFNISLSYTVVSWMTGRKSVIPKFFPETSLRKEKLEVDEYFQVQGERDIFALGDIACNMDDQLKPSAQVAMPQGKAAVGILMALRSGHSPKPFKYIDLGEMIGL